MEKQENLEKKVSKKNIIKKLRGILNPLRCAKSLAPNELFERSPLEARALYITGFAAPIIFTVGMVGTISTGLYGTYELIEKYLS